MYASDFAHARSTHELLLLLLLSETGVGGIGPAHPSVQYQGLTSALPHLKQKLLAESWDPKAAFGLDCFSGISVELAADAHLFVDLCRKLTSLAKLGVNEEELVRLGAYPFIKDAVFSTPEIAESLRFAVRKHTSAYGPAVEARIRRTLEAFGLAGLDGQPLR